MTSITICPNCGAGIVGTATYCPRCDYPLAGQKSTSEAAPAAPLIPPELPDNDGDTFQVIAAVNAEIPKDATPAYLKEFVLPPEDEPLENARTAPVPQGYIGITAPPELEATRSHNARGYQAAIAMQPQALPSAPYTPPPLVTGTISVTPYSYPSNYYLQQRLETYVRGGYRLRSQSNYQAVLAYGKPLSFGWWLVAMLSGIGLVWYFLIQLTSGFSKDVAYLVVERDGTLYEDGAGAAHTRLQHARNGRRWGFLGFGLFFLALLTFVLLVGVGVVGVNEYRAELLAAYPDFTLLEDGTRPSTADLNPADIDFVRQATLGFIILLALTVLGALAGITLTLIGFLQSAAYMVDVPPLPDYL